MKYMGPKNRTSVSVCFEAYLFMFANSSSRQFSCRCTLLYGIVNIQVLIVLGIFDTRPEVERVQQRPGCSTFLYCAVQYLIFKLENNIANSSAIYQKNPIFIDSCALIQSDSCGEAGRKLKLAAVKASPVFRINVEYSSVDNLYQFFFHNGP